MPLRRATWCSTHSVCELFFPLEGAGSLRGSKSPKNGEKLPKFPSLPCPSASLPCPSVPWFFGFPWLIFNKEFPWLFWRFLFLFQAICGFGGEKILGKFEGFSLIKPKNQGTEGQGGPTPENGENCPKKGVKLLRKYNFCNFYVIFPHFRGSDHRGGNFVIFPHFSGISSPGGFPGPLRGKTTCNTLSHLFSKCLRVSRLAGVPDCCS